MVRDYQPFSAKSYEDQQDLPESKSKIVVGLNTLQKFTEGRAARVNRCVIVHASVYSQRFEIIHQSQTTLIAIVI